MGQRDVKLCPCPKCGRRVVYGATVVCGRCESAEIERRYQIAHAYYRRTLTLTDADCWSGVGTSLATAQDHAPAYAEVTGFRARKGRHATDVVSHSTPLRRR